MIASRSMIVLLLAILLMAILTGSSCAAFLWLLDVVTDLRHKHEWLVFFLPIAGLVSGWMYSKWGDRVEGGNNLVLDEIHRPTSGVPIRIAPMVLLGTLITHLFGGAAGREGTAVQMAAGISEFCRRWFGISDPGRQSLLLQTSVAAGFSGVFGTPIAGALFALEVVRRQAIHTTSLPVCLAAAVISDRICLAWGATHTHYTIRPELFANAAGDSATVAPSILNLILYAAVFGVAFGAAAVLFCRATHHISDLSKRYIRNPSFRPAIGGLCVLTAYLLFGGADYLGLGVERQSQLRFDRELLQREWREAIQLAVEAGSHIDDSWLRVQGRRSDSSVFRRRRPWKHHRIGVQHAARSLRRAWICLSLCRCDQDSCEQPHHVGGTFRL